MAKVLVIDDEDNNRLLLATLLTHAGHTPIEAATGTSGFEAATEHQPDLIVVDLSLPDLNGPELIRRLRRDERTAKTPIALYTATDAPAAIEELVDLYGLSGVIPKPGDARQILDSFHRLLGERQSHS